MIKFDNDYLEGAHPKVMQKLSESNFLQTIGYGEDEYTEKARELIKTACGSNSIGVHFLVGGTQANLTLISASLRPHQGVISAGTGHINTHETGAIEATGHKIIVIPSENGKLNVEDIRKTCDDHLNDSAKEHIVQPGMVYISNSTELGSTYGYKELKGISEFCKRRDLLLFLDGARLGYALESEGNDLNLNHLVQFCDAFYIGGTKVGALFGEAMVISNPKINEDFRYIIKQKGGLLAKGRLLGLQFMALFEDDLYFEISRHANKLAKIIRKTCEDKGFDFISESKTNQQFPIIPNNYLDELQKKYSFAVWEKTSKDKTAVRICTSWATSPESVEALCEDIRKL